jgi:DNA-binding Lrp family transcriptional regulator
MKNKVLEILRTNARTPSREIARRLQISEEEVERQIAELEKTKTILGYQAVINPEKLDEEPVLGIIEVKVRPERQGGYDAIAEQIYRFPEVKLCFLLSGTYDLLVFVEGPTLKSVAHFVTDKLATINHVTSTNSHFILKKYKEFGVVFGMDERAERLVVSP